MIDPTVLSRVRELCEDSLRVPSQTSSVAYVDLLGDANIQLDARHVVALLDENAALRERSNALEAKLAAFIANVDEMHIGVGLPPMFTVLHEGKTYAVQPEVPKAWYEAIRDKWEADSGSLIATWNTMASNEFRANARADRLESRLAALTAAGEKVVEARGLWGKSGSCRCWNREKCPSCDSEIALADALDAFSELLRSDP